GPDFTIGSVVRTANAFAVAAVHIVGRRRWNRRGAMVTDRYQHLYHHPDVASLVAWAQEEGLPLIGIDNVPGSLPIEHRPLPARAVMLFGQESGGRSAQARAACSEILNSTQHVPPRYQNGAAHAPWYLHVTA